MSTLTSAVPGTLVPVLPSRFVRVVIRPMTRILNPLILKFAGRRHVRTAALVRHVGRRSGREYVTPVGAAMVGDAVIIPLTFGNQSDWARNIRAAGGCSIRIGGRDYQATDPQFLDADAAAPMLRSAFSWGLRAFIRLVGIRQYLLLQVVR